jgi:hypothetical protein
VWPVALSGRLPVVALVSHYLTNKLIGRESIPNRKTFHTETMRLCVISGISFGFPKLFQSQGQVTHVLLTRSPLITQEQALKITVRLACVKHAASVRPEPGSNSPLMSKIPNPKTGKIHNHKVLQTRLSTNNQQKADHSSSTKGKTSPTQTHHHPQRATAHLSQRQKDWHRFLTRC